MGSPSGLATLPPEILSLIMEHTTDRFTLLSLCLSCSTFRRGAEVYLYTSIDTREIHRHHQFLSTITANSRLARLVRSYRNHDFHSCFFAPHASAQLFKQGLQSMVKLRDLHFINNWGSKQKTEFLKQCGFQLESFAWRCRISDWESMVSFLRQQHSLERLILTHAQGEMCLPLDACRNLSSLSGPLSVLEAFLPGRKVTTVYWIPGFPDKFTPEVGSRLAGSFNQLRFLSIGCYIPGTNLCGIADHLCLLEVLEVSRLGPDESLLLPKLPRLNNIIFSFGGLGVDFIPGISIEDPADVVNGIFTTCAVIRRVDIQYKQVEGYDFYICWIDNVQQDGLAWKRRTVWVWT